MTRTNDSLQELEHGSSLVADGDPLETVKAPRPGLVTVLAILQVLGGVALVVTVILGRETLISTLSGYGIFAQQMVVASLLLGAVSVAAGIGMWLGKRWGWWLAAFVYIYSILRAISALISIPMVVDAFGEPSRGTGYSYARQAFNAAWNVLYLVYWFSAGVRDFFGLENLSRLRAILTLAAVCILIIVAGNLLGGFAGGDLERIAQIYEDGDLDTALEELEIYLESHPDDDLAWTILGHVSQDAGAFEDAEAAYDRAIAINPKRHEAWTGLGVLNRVWGDDERALECYEKALEIEPDDPDTHSSLAVLALTQYQDEKALLHAEKARALDKRSPVVAANLAVVYHYNGMYEARDEMTAEAERLGYDSMELLRMVYEGIWSIRE